MEIRLAQPVGFSQPGSRSNNEDSLFPNPDVVTPQQSWFMVCDGVGGAERGEVASQLAVTQFDAYFRANPVSVVTAEYIQKALSTVQDKFDAYVSDYPAATGMGTTLTLVYLHEGGATVAHLGDSRVYLIRQGRIEWRTDDHSYVNELVKGGVLTAEQARNHPQRNIITRAIQGGSGRSDRSIAAVQFISDLQPGDYFFLCSDGVLERVSDELLENVLGSQDSNAEKMQVIQACCEDQTRDNFTAYLLQIQAVSGAQVPGFADDRPAYERPVPAPADDITVVALPHVETENVRAADVMALHDSVPTVKPKPVESPAAAPVAKTSSGNRALWLGIVVFVVVGSFVGWKTIQKQQANETGSHLSDRAKPMASGNVKVTRRPVVASLPSPVSTSMSVDTATLDTPVTEQVAAVPEAPRTPAADTPPSIKREVEDGLYVGQLNGKQGLLTADRKTWLIDPLFDKIGTFQNGLAKVSLDGETKYLSRKGKLYDEVGTEQCNRVRVRFNDKYGYLDHKGDLAIGIRYQKASPFSDDCTAKVYVEDQLFRIDRNGLDVKTGRGPQVVISHRTTK